MTSYTFTTVVRYHPGPEGQFGEWVAFSRCDRCNQVVDERGPIMHALVGCSLATEAIEADRPEDAASPF